VPLTILPDVMLTFPPASVQALKLPVMVSVSTPVPADVRGGLKLTFNLGSVHVTVPVALPEKGAFGVAPAGDARNATLVSGSAAARTPMKILRLLLWMDIVPSPLCSLDVQPNLRRCRGQTQGRMVPSRPPKASFTRRTQLVDTES